MSERFVEKPAVHHSWTDYENFGVFEYGTYPEGSVLEGQERRSCLGSFATLQEAQIEFPDAKYVEGSGFVDRPISETPPAWFDPDAIGERWTDD